MGNNEQRNNTLLKSSETQLGLAGFLFLTTALVCVATLVAMVIRVHDIKPADIQENTRTLVVVTHYVDAFAGPIILFFTSVLAAILGFAMLQAAGKATRIVIPERDRPILEKMLSENNELGINLYARLSSLTGLIGAFTKVGLSGLPLATISLAVIFSLLALFPGKHSDGFFDLAKLTLGAFIGSYVQRHVSETGRTVTVHEQKKDGVEQDKNGEDDKTDDVDEKQNDDEDGVDREGKKEAKDENQTEDKEPENSSPDTE